MEDDFGEDFLALVALVTVFLALVVVGGGETLLLLLLFLTLLF